MVEAVFRVGTGVRRAVKQHCGGSGWCTNATLDLKKVENEGLDVIEELSIKAQRPRYEVLRFKTGEDGVLTFTSVRTERLCIHLYIYLSVNPCTVCIYV